MPQFSFGSFSFGNGKTEPAVQHPKRGTRLTRTLISLAVTLIFGFLYFYIALPALNFHNSGLYGFIILLCIVFTVVYVLLLGFRATKGRAFEYVTFSVKTLKIPSVIVGVMIAVLILGSICGWTLFNAKRYSSLLTTATGDFATDVTEISFDKIPMLDEASANNLANRKLGDLPDLVSQFTVNEESSQINYLNKPVRVSYLDYESFFKWLANRNNGIEAYLMVDMVTQEATVKRLSEGIKYSPSEYFNRDLERHLRFRYPTLLFGDVNFEIDDNGTPYWVASVVRKTIGLFDGTDPKGAVLVNAQTGESTYYDMKDIPTWTDRVTPASLIIEQYDYYGRFRNGFWNSLFGQKDCTETTDGYNYIALNDDVWMYTGITSISEDRGNIGFILVNQRTKESKYYACAGAEEFSAMSSAEGAVQQFGYVSTFPLLLNIEGQPTYFMALKDDGGLVKMYGMVNVHQYQIVAIGSKRDECLANYRALLKQNGIETSEPPVDTTETVTGAVSEIREATFDGNTFYFIRLDDGTVYYRVAAKDFPVSVLLDVADRITVVFKIDDAEIKEVTSLTREP